MPSQLVKEKMKSHIYLLLGLYFIAAFIGRSASAVPEDPFLGIPPEDVKYYKTSGEVIKCKDGSTKFTRAQLNDDFCDCPDGSDEPGTSACPTGKFHCRNEGHASLLLFSSRVNDGICDCCDGSDEYDSKVKCPNTCWEAGKVARDKLKKKIATYQEGVTIRKREVEQAKLAIVKDEAELSTMKNEEKILKGLVQQLKERKEQIEKAEEEERLQREKEKAKKEKEEKVDQDTSKAKERTDGGEENPSDNTNDDKIGLLEDSPIVQDVAEDYIHTEAEVEHIDDFESEGSPVDGAEKYAVEDKEVSTVTHETNLNAVSEASSDQHEKQENDKVENSEDLSKEELGRLVASRWTGENTGKQTEEVHAAQNHDHEGHEETAKDALNEEHDGYASDSDDDNQKYGDNDVEDQIDEDFEEDHDDSSSYKPDSDDESYLSDVTSPSGSSWLEKIQQTVRNIIDSVNVFKAPVNISDAAHVRKEYEESSAKLSKIQSKISSLTQKLKHDFGPNKEFYSFYGRCFESKQNKYVYKVCPYKQASQVEGHSTTRLGQWDKFEDSYRAMLFSNGDKCWNGPDRSLKVKLRCGLKIEVADIDEPSRCEYVALLSSPALCLEEKLKELQDKLELMNKKQPQNHDEL